MSWPAPAPPRRWCNAPPRESQGKGAGSADLCVAHHSADESIGSTAVAAWIAASWSGPGVEAAGLTRQSPLKRAECQAASIRHRRSPPGGNGPGRVTHRFLSRGAKVPTPWRVPGAKATGLKMGRPTKGAVMATCRRIRSGLPPGATSPVPSVGLAVSAWGFPPGTRHRAKTPSPHVLGPHRAAWPSTLPIATAVCTETALPPPTANTDRKRHHPKPWRLARSIVAASVALRRGAERLTPTGWIG